MSCPASPYPRPVCTQPRGKAPEGQSFPTRQLSLLSHGGRRSIRSIGRSIDRIDRFDRFDKFSDFLARRGARDLSGVKVSALYDVWRPKKHRKTETKKIEFAPT